MPILISGDSSCETILEDALNKMHKVHTWPLKENEDSLKQKNIDVLESKAFFFSLKKKI